MELEKVYDYFHNYDKQAYQVIACMGNEPSEQDIKGRIRKLGEMTYEVGKKIWYCDVIFPNCAGSSLGAV